MQKAKFRFVSAPLAIAIAMAFAVPAMAANGIAPALKQAMKRDLGLTDVQLGQYLKTERLAAQAQALDQRQGRASAGSWIERKANGDFQYVVATTSAGAQKAPAGIEIRQMRHSLADLNASKGQLDTLLAQGAKVPKGVYGWGVDLQSNSVVVSIGRDGQQAGIDFVARSGADAQTVRFQTEDEQPTLRSVNIQGGRGYNSVPGDGYIYACSVGFSVTRNGTPGFVTAGHCDEPGQVYNEEGSFNPGEAIGTFAASSFPQPGGTGPDYAWVQVYAGNPLLGSVYGYGKGDVTVTGHTAGGVGTAICRSGRTTGWHCGTVQALNVTVNYSSGETVTGLTQTTACSEGGDSGGSYITGTGQAQGVLSGGSGNCKGDKNTTFSSSRSASTQGKPSGGGGGGSKPSKATTFFTPVNPILSAYNLTIVTGN